MPCLLGDLHGGRGSRGHWQVFEGEDAILFFISVNLLTLETSPNSFIVAKGLYGTGMSGPSFGVCPVDRDWMTERYNRGESGMTWMSSPPEAPRSRDGTNELMSLLALKKISAFSGIGHGF